MNNVLDEYYKILLENINPKDFAERMYKEATNDGNKSEHKALLEIEYILNNVNGGEVVQGFNNSVLENCFRIAFKNVLPNFDKEFEDKVINLTINTKNSWSNYTDKFFEVIDIVKNLY
ncbi:hypothetical protein 8014-B2_004 [Lactobacillus phage ATCC 8014-B2]|uniref:Uncharacterized protein n=1 Tax=Lactobacillus phage ATCC 8014-B2 TaxID=1225795 RepID=K4HZM0_9CAUD|nr:hypothetical protein HOQ89_gp004 [Lactobacillus phage ATCC 8014-B2]AFU63071.1 hypothetical protein 8014-B2_004 [Lactobacillus phage ATCC 8014-B2]